MAVYVNGTQVKKCEGVWVNGGVAQKVFVNGSLAYESDCGPSCDFIWSNSTMQMGTIWPNCPGSGTMPVDGCGVRVNTNKHGLASSYYYTASGTWYDGLNYINNAHCSVGNGAADCEFNSAGNIRTFHVNFNTTKITVSVTPGDPIEGYEGEIIFDTNLVNFSGYARISRIVNTDITRYHGLTTSGGAILAFSGVYCSPGDYREDTGDPMWAVDAKESVNNSIARKDRLHFSWNGTDDTGLVVNANTNGLPFKDNKPKLSFEYDTVSYSNWISCNNYIYKNGIKEFLNASQIQELSKLASEWLIPTERTCNGNANNTN